MGSPGNGKYDGLDLAVLELFANGLVGEPNVQRLIEALGYTTEEDLRQGEGKGLLDLFEAEGDFFENYAAIERRINRGRLGFSIYEDALR